jgi:transmembrane sensor
MGVPIEDDDRSGPGSARDAAIEWWVCVKAGLASGSAHAAAFTDISQMFEHVKEMRRSRPAKRLVVAPRRSWLAGAAAFAAASLALYVSFDGLSTFLRSDYSTGTGETQRVTLADGSRVEAPMIARRYR